ncbi:hypothetical protein BH23ACT2_BH23ACT2_20800 [soil metagenome]
MKGHRWCAVRQPSPMSAGPKHLRRPVGSHRDDSSWDWVRPSRRRSGGRRRFARRPPAAGPSRWTSGTWRASWLWWPSMRTVWPSRPWPAASGRHRCPNRSRSVACRAVAAASAPMGPGRPLPRPTAATRARSGARRGRRRRDGLGTQVAVYGIAGDPNRSGDHPARCPSPVRVLVGRWSPGHLVGYPARPRRRPMATSFDGDDHIGPLASIGQDSALVGIGHGLGHFGTLGRTGERSGIGRGLRSTLAGGSRGQADHAHADQPGHQQRDRHEGHHLSPRLANLRVPPPLSSHEHSSSGQAAPHWATAVRSAVGKGGDAEGKGDKGGGRCPSPMDG